MRMVHLVAALYALSVVLYASSGSDRHFIAASVWAATLCLVIFIERRT